MSREIQIAGHEHAEGFWHLLREAIGGIIPDPWGLFACGGIALFAALLAARWAWNRGRA